MNDNLLGINRLNLQSAKSLLALAYKNHHQQLKIRRGY